MVRVRLDRDGALTADAAADGLFPWWSVTKTVLACCALRLAEQGRLQLDGCVSGRPYSLRQLLQHRAGVPNYGGLRDYHEAVARGEDPWSDDALLTRVGKDRLLFPPDQGWAYSNVGYLFVRRMVEDVMSTDLDRAMGALVFAPLGLDSCRVAALPDDLEALVWGNPNRYHPGWVYHGLVIGSAIDAARFLQKLMAGDLVSPAHLTEMTAAFPLGGGIAGRPWTETGYGLGLMSSRMTDVGRAIGHSGAGPGTVCAVYHFPDAPRGPCTAAAFARGGDEGVTEHAVRELAMGPQTA